MKLLPLTVTLNAVPQAVAEEGESELTDGAGLGGGWLEAPPHPQAAITTAKMKAIAGVQGATRRRLRELGIGHPGKRFDGNYAPTFSDRQLPVVVS
jgi:hypothetical protein